jgi:exonuclease 3'-5' domain-containing protein 2
MLYDVLESKRKQLRPAPPRPYHAELNLPIRLTSGAIIPAAEDPVEDVEPEVELTETSSSTPASAREAAAQNVQVEDDFELHGPISKGRPRTGKQPTSSKKSVILLPRLQALIDAESWATAHRASNPAPSTSTNSPTTANFAALRVYRLWYSNPELSIAEIASMLRQPPLQKTTVGQYILDSIRLEKLPFEKGRLKNVLLSVPDSRSLWRYKAIWNMVE